MGLVDPCRDHGNAAVVRLIGIIHRAEDNVDIVACDLTHIVNRIGSVKHGNIAGYVDDDVGRACDRRLQKRAFHGCLDRNHSLILALSFADADVRNALVAHNGLHIRKVQIDDCGHIDQVGNPLHRLLQHLVRLHQRLGHARPFVNDFKNLIIWDHDQRVHTVAQLLNTGKRVVHTGLCLETERLRHNADR